MIILHFSTSKSSLHSIFPFINSDQCYMALIFDQAGNCNLEFQRCFILFYVEDLKFRFCELLHGHWCRAAAVMCDLCMLGFSPGFLPLSFSASFVLSLAAHFLWCVSNVDTKELCGKYHIWMSFRLHISLICMDIVLYLVINQYRSGYLDIYFDIISQ